MGSGGAEWVPTGQRQDGAPMGHIGDGPTHVGLGGASTCRAVGAAVGLSSHPRCRWDPAVPPPGWAHAGGAPMGGGTCGARAAPCTKMLVATETRHFPSPLCVPGGEGRARSHVQCSAVGRLPLRGFGQRSSPPKARGRPWGSGWVWRSSRPLWAVPDVLVGKGCGRSPQTAPKSEGAVLTERSSPCPPARPDPPHPFPVSLWGHRPRQDSVTLRGDITPMPPPSMGTSPQCHHSPWGHRPTAITIHGDTTPLPSPSMGTSLHGHHPLWGPSPHGHHPPWGFHLSWGRHLTAITIHGAITPRPTPSMGPPFFMGPSPHCHPSPWSHHSQWGRLPTATPSVTTSPFPLPVPIPRRAFGPDVPTESPPSQQFSMSRCPPPTPGPPLPTAVGTIPARRSPPSIPQP